MTPKGRPYTGISCPRCHSVNSHVIDSRNCDDKQARRRRHQCNDCEQRYTTYEIYAAEYERLQTLQVSVAQVEVAIATLQTVRSSLNGSEVR